MTSAKKLSTRQSTDEPSNGRTYQSRDVLAVFNKSIGYQLRKTHRLSENFMQTKLAKFGIQVGMWYFLRTLWIEDGITQRELSLRAGATEPTTLEQLRKMEKAGLILRRRDERDQRCISVMLTPKGRKLERILLPYVDELNTIALRGFSRQQAQDLKDMLHRVRQNLRAAKIDAD